MNDESENADNYDYSKRDPLFAGAERTCLWELKVLSAHFHPTVRKFVKSIISGETINYEGTIYDI